MSRARAAPRPPDRLAAYWRAIHLTNVSGLATRKHYEIAFGAMGREMREEMCGQVVFALALREAGVPIGGIIEVGTYPPNDELPPHVRQHLGDIDGTRVRELVWTPDGDGWKISAFAREQATRHGWPRASYERLQADVDGLLPAPDSEEIALLTAGRAVAPTDDVDRTPWITYTEMADLITR